VSLNNVVVMAQKQGSGGDCCFFVWRRRTNYHLRAHECRTAKKLVLQPRIY
jgi:hypothetical protein